MNTSGSTGETMLAVAALAAVQLTRGRSPEEINLMAAFFTTLGDGIAVIAAGQAADAARKSSVNSIDNPSAMS